MANSSARHHNILLLTTLFLVTLARQALSVHLCPNCGTRPVPYPLSTGPTCGDQLYKLRCNGGSLLFDTINNTYPVTSISSQNQRLTIQPSPFIPNTCITEDISTQGIQLNSSLPFNITSSNTILYLNCSNLLLSSPLDCNSSSLCHTYINGSVRGASNGGACGNSQICCTFRAGGSSTAYSMRVRTMGCAAYESFVNLDYSLPVRQWPQPGLELQWASPSEPVCGTQSDCDPNSACGPDPNSNSGVRRCFCNSGFHWDPLIGFCAQGNVPTFQMYDPCISSVLPLSFGVLQL